MAIDASNDRGQFLLAGSTRFLTTRRLSETLTGRIGIVDLLPLSAGEIRSVVETFVDLLFDESFDPLSFDCSPLSRSDYAESITMGGFPELVLGPQTSRFRNPKTQTRRPTICRSNLSTLGLDMSTSLPNDEAPLYDFVNHDG